MDNGHVTTLEGVLQIYHNKQFYHICDDGFNQEEAQVLHFSPKETQVLEGCISFGEECVSVNLTS